MPDHFRQQPPQANPVALVAPRSPPEHPLSLVIGKRGHDDHHHHHHPGQTPPHHRHSRDTPPPASPSQSKGSAGSTAEEDERCPPPAHVHPHHMHPADEDKQAPQQAHQSPGRSSGFSEQHSSPEHIPDMPDNNLTGSTEEAAGATGRQEDIPLALVVPKGGVAGGDSGHEDDFSGGESSPAQGTTPPLQVPVSYVVGRQDIRRSRLSHPGALVMDKVPAGDDDGVLNHSLKIRDFARMTEEARQQHPQQHPASLAGAKRLSTATSHHGKPHTLDHLSDTASVSSIDTWGSSLADVRSAMSGTFPRAIHPAARRKSRANSAGGIATTGGAMGAPIYSCQYCDKSFVNKYHLASHVVTHTGERNFACTHCNKTFGRKSTLRAHMTTHTKSSNFMCPLCKKACNDNNSLEEHIRMHTGEKPFVCSVCSKAYARKSHLNVHYRVHTGERPFVCVDCGKDFTEKRFLNDHMQTAHSGGGDDGPLRCPNCFREFAYKTSLKQHLKKQMCVKNINRAQGQGSHGPHPKQFQCPFCEKSYSWKQTLKQVRT